MYCGVEAPTGDGWEQDPDTLDTWFSSGLWTFSTLGWPDNSKDLTAYHPTAVLETGYDILFFWVARMILMTTYTLGDIPFKNVYLHGLVRDEQGRKMSKSLGNIIDPLDMIAKFGTDATRLSLILGNTPGNDMKLSEEKVAGFRNFTNKLWNIARFMLINIGVPVLEVSYPKAKTLADTAILTRLQSVITEATKDIEEYRFSMAGEKLRDFTWNDLADWYLEIAKVEGEKSTILNYILNTILKLWHPFMPFVTETIWQEVYGEEEMLMVAAWPHAEKKVDTEAWEEFDQLRMVIGRLRTLRAEYRVAPGQKLDGGIFAGDMTSTVKNNLSWITRFGQLGAVDVEKKGTRPEGAVGFVEQGIEVYVNLLSAIDVTKEKARIEKELNAIEPYIAGLEKKLSNADFVNNAPKIVVVAEQGKLDEAKKKLEKLKNQLAFFM